MKKADPNSDHTGGLLDLLHRLLVCVYCIPPKLAPGSTSSHDLEEMESRGFLFCPSSKSVKNLINRSKTLDFYQLVIYN